MKGPEMHPSEPGARQAKKPRFQATGDPGWVRVICVGLTLAFIALMLLFPLMVVFTEAFRKGLGVYFAAITEADARAAIRLTLLAAGIAVPLNTLFGLAAAWCVARFRFPGRNLLTALIDLPFSVSPVVAGLLFVLLFGSGGLLAAISRWSGIQILFAVPGIVLATMFVTLPFVARELIALMQEQGDEEELAAMVLGANGWQTFWRITLPNIKWGLLYGMILCNARAMGEFGAVSVVSGHIRGVTNTLPLHVEILFNEYNFAASFAAASLLTLLALVTLVIKTFVAWRERNKGIIAESHA